MAGQLEKSKDVLHDWAQVLALVKSKLESAVGSVKVAVEGAQAAVTSGGDAALKVGGCFAASLEASAKASVSINVSVKASASASGSASSG